jgi:hypothetical protein
MGHRAAIYTVRAHKKGKPKELLPLGDIDDGTYLGDVLETLFGTFAAQSNTKQVRCLHSELDDTDLRLSFHHGESGLVADILDDKDQLLLRQAQSDTQLVRCGSLFRLPRSQTVGWWAVHVNNNRSAKGLVHAEMLNRFRKNYPDLMLLVQPAVMSSALKAALDDGRLNSIKLIKLDKSSDFANAKEWVAKDAHAKVELRVSALEQGTRLLTGLVQKAVKGDEKAYGKVVEFGGLTFDQAKIEVTLENGSQRTFNVQGPQSGHPLPADIEPLLKDGEPTDESLWDELAKVLEDLG